MRIKQPPMPSFISSVGFMGMDMSLFLLSLMASIQIGYENGRPDNLSVLYIVLVLGLTGFIVYFTEKRRCFGFVNADVFMSTDAMDWAKMIYAMIVLTEHSDDEYCKDQLHVCFQEILITEQFLGSLGGSGKIQQRLEALILPNRDTEYEENVEEEVVFEEKKYERKLTGASFGRTGTFGTNNGRNAARNQDVYQPDSKSPSYILINELCQIAIKKFPKEMYFRLLAANLMTARLHLKWKAIHEIAVISDSNASIMIKSDANRLLQLIEHDVLEAEIRSSQTLGIDARNILLQQQNFEGLKKLLGQACQATQAFWKELIEPQPNAHKLQDIGFEISRIGERVAVFVGGDKGSNSGSGISGAAGIAAAGIGMDGSRSLRISELFGDYISMVLQEPEEARKLLSKVDYLKASIASSRMFTDDQRLLNLETVNPCIVVASGDKKTMGKILEANTEALNTLDFTRPELIGNNLNTFIPKVYADHHIAWMTRYFDQNVERVMNSERRVYAMNKSGFIIPCDLLIKVIPDLSNGIRVVGIFAKINFKHSPCRMLVDGRSGDLLGLTQDMYEHFGVHPALCLGNPMLPQVLNILQILPKVQNLSDITSPATGSVDYELDTTVLTDLLLGLQPEQTIGVPPPKRQNMRQFLVRLYPGSTQSHGASNLDIFELEIEEVFREAGIMGSLFGVGVMDVASGLKMVNDMSIEEIPLGLNEKKDPDSRVSSKHTPPRSVKSQKSVRSQKSGKSSNSNKSRRSKGLDMDDLTESEIEALNFKAERERKLKEYKQLLKIRRMPFLVRVAYMVTLLLLIVAFLMQALTLVFKQDVLISFYDEVESIYAISERSTLIPDIAFRMSELINQVKFDYSGRDTTRDNLLQLISKLKDKEQICEANFLKISDIQNTSRSYVPYEMINLLREKFEINLYLPDALFEIVTTTDLVVTSSDSDLNLSASVRGMVVGGSSTQQITDIDQAIYFIDSNYPFAFKEVSEAEVIQYVEIYDKHVLSLTWWILGFFCMLVLSVACTFIVLAEVYRRMTRRMAQVLNIFTHVDHEEIKRFVHACQMFHNKYYLERDITAFENMLYGFDEDDEDFSDGSNKEDHDEPITPGGLISPANRKSALASPEKSDNEDAVLPPLPPRVGGLKRVHTEHDSRGSKGNKKASFMISDEVKPTGRGHMTVDFVEVVTPRPEAKKKDSMKDSAKDSLKDSGKVDDDYAASGDSRRNLRSNSERTLNSKPSLLAPRGFRQKKVFTTKRKLEKEPSSESIELKSNKLQYKGSFLAEVFKRTLIASVLVCPLVLYDLWRDYENYKEHQAIVSHVVTFSSLMLNIKYLHAFTYENVSLGSSTNLTASSIYSTANLAEYTQGVLIEKLRAAVQNAPTMRTSTGDWFSSAFDHYKEQLDFAMDNDLCTPDVGSLYMSECMSSTFMRNGLQTTVFGFIESSRNITGITTGTVQNMLGMSRNSELTYISLRMGEVAEQLSIIFSKQLVQVIESKKLVESLLFFSILFGWLIVYYFSFHRYFTTLNEKMWLTQGMVGMLPFQTVINNAVLYKEIARWRNI